MIQLLFLTLVYQQRYQPPPDKELYPTTEYLSNAMIAGRWERAKTLLKEIGSFKKAKYQAQGKHIISDLCQYSGASDRYANVLTGIRMVYEAGADPTGNRNGAIAGTTGKDQWGQITERLLQYGVNPNDRCGGNESSQGSPPLLASVLYNPKTIATEVLLKYGADPNTLNIAEGNLQPTREMYNMSYMMIATVKGKTAFIPVLLKHKAKVDLRCPDNGMTALHFAARCNRSEIIPILLKAGANKRMKDKNGQTPLQIAKKAKATKVIKLLS